MLCQFEGDAQRAWFIEAVERIARIRRWLDGNQASGAKLALDDQLARVKPMGGSQPRKKLDVRCAEMKILGC